MKAKCFHNLIILIYFIQLIQINSNKLALKSTLKTETQTKLDNIDIYKDQKIAIQLRPRDENSKNIFLYPDLSGCSDNSNVPRLCGYVYAIKSQQSPIKFRVVKSNFSDTTGKTYHCIQSIENEYVFLAFQNLADRVCGSVDNEICKHAQLVLSDSTDCSKLDASYSSSLYFHNVRSSTYNIFLKGVDGNFNTYLEVLKVPTSQNPISNSLVARTHYETPSFVNEVYPHFYLTSCNYLVGQSCFIKMGLAGLTELNINDIYKVIIQSEYNFDESTISTNTFRRLVKPGSQVGQYGKFVIPANSVTEGDPDVLIPNTENIMIGRLLKITENSDGTDQSQFVMFWNDDNQTPVIFDSESSYEYRGCGDNISPTAIGYGKKQNINQIVLAKCKGSDDLYTITSMCYGDEGKKTVLFMKNWKNLTSSETNYETNAFCFNIYLATCDKADVTN